MNKSLAYLLIAVFGTIGGYLPMLFGGGELSGWSILGTAIGGFLGLYLAYKISSG